MTQLDTEIDEYLARYALTAFDSKAAANLWATPGMIIDDRFAGVLDDRETMAQGLEQSYPLYRKLGLSSVTHELLKIDDLTEALELVKVRWHFYDTHGAQLTESTAYSIVRRDEGSLHACVCIQIDDADKLQALAAERGVDLADHHGYGD